MFKINAKEISNILYIREEWYMVSAVLLFDIRIVVKYL